MSNNPFKTQYKRSIEDNIHRSNQNRGSNVRDTSNTMQMHNRFRGKDAKPTFSLTNEDFPEMIAPQMATTNVIVGLDYKAATFAKDTDEASKETPTNQDYIPPGYTLIYMDENRNIVHKHGEHLQNRYCIYSNDIEVEPRQVLQQLVNNWSLRKQQYDDLHGEGEYDRMYGMPTTDYEYSEDDEYYDVNDYYDY